MPEKTGKSLDVCFKLLKNRYLNKHSDILASIKGDHGVTHGYAYIISPLFRQTSAGGPPTHAELIAAQYEKKPNLKPLYGRLVKEAKEFGKDVEVAPKKANVSLRRARQLAIIQPSTKTRMELELNLDKEMPLIGRLIKGDRWSGMCSHHIEIHSLDEITPDVLEWLKKAYIRAV